MKSRVVPMSEYQIKQVVQEESDRLRDDIYNEAIRDFAPQLMAMCLLELNKTNGYGKKRLKRFIDGVNSLFLASKSSGLYGKEFNTLNVMAYIRDKYDIDLEVQYGE